MIIHKLIVETEHELQPVFEKIDEIALHNQNKVLNAFRAEKIAARHFAPTNGYGYDDAGRDALCRLYSDVFGAESAVVSPFIVNGTHAISLALFATLKNGDVLLSATGKPYDTLENVILGENIGSLKDIGVSYAQVELKTDAGGACEIDIDILRSKIIELKPAVVFFQRSRGYSWRDALKLDQLKEAFEAVKKIKDVTILVDNCYGEFVETIEPTQIGADMIAGSLIKNPGGGLAPTGGYIAGKAPLIERVAGRLTVPGTGMEVGSYQGTYRLFFQGFFMAPHVVSQALKSAALFCGVFSKLGFQTSPKIGQRGGDIIASIRFKSANELITFCQTVQKFSPVDSFVTPEPWDMPGYRHQVIMAAGSFVQGSSIELSADSPIKPPYTAYIQGALTYEHAKIALNNMINEIQ